MDDDMYRPTLLTPPVQSWALSPLRPLSERRPKGQGLKDEEFQVLLRSSKERSAVAASKKTDLRKEVALRAHKNKQRMCYSFIFIACFFSFFHTN